MLPAGVSVLTDEVSISFPSGRAAVLALYSTSTQGRYKPATTGWTSYYRSGNSVTTVDATVDGSEPRIYFISKIECFVP